MQGKIDDDGSRKDANEVLQKDGAAPLRCFLELSPAYPIKGLYSFSDYHDQIWDVYEGAATAAQPVSTGWKVLDDFYRIVPGELSLVTGAPFPATFPRAFLAHCVACHVIRKQHSRSIVLRCEREGICSRLLLFRCVAAAGIPNSGKSEFIDALALSLAQNHYWPIAFCSLE